MKNIELRRSNKSLVIFLLSLTFSIVIHYKNTAQEAGMPDVKVKIPTQSQKVLNRLREDNPNEKFEYKEFSADLSMIKIRNSLGINQIILNIEDIKEKNRLGLVVSTSVEFKRKFELAKFPNRVYDIVEEPPYPIGGMKLFNEYLANNLVYPSKAKSKGIEGRVFATFVVDKTGRLTDIKIVKGIGHGCDQSTENVLAQADNWMPGKHHGTAVNVRIIIPVTFVLGELLSDVDDK